MTEAQAYRWLVAELIALIALFTALTEWLA